MYKVAIKKQVNQYWQLHNAILDIFKSLGCDLKNPFQDWIKPGDTVLIKPNWVLDRNYNGKDLYSVITYIGLIEEMIYYARKALGDTGRIIVADAPQYDCDWNKLHRNWRWMPAVYKIHNVELYDLRPYWCPPKHGKSRHMQSYMKKLDGDPAGYRPVDLFVESAFFGRNMGNSYGACSNMKQTRRAHGCVWNGEEIREQHVYGISKTFLDADVVISLPKMKTHKKVGVTLNCKGLVGIATHKNSIPHFSIGSPKEGGDQYPDGHFNWFERRLIKLERWMYKHLLTGNRFKEAIHRAIYWLHGKTLFHLGLRINQQKRKFDKGNWRGNDTCWRSVSDLVKIAYFADKNGKIKSKQQRRFFSIVDGIIGGEDEGPLSPTPKYAGVLVGGFDLLAVDIVASYLMGFDATQLKQFGVRNDPKFESKYGAIDVIGDGTPMPFKKHIGWEK